MLTRPAEIDPLKVRMGIVTAILCIHMLLWAGCNAASSVHKLGSDEILLRKAQPSKIFWRKLLEENVSKPDVIKAETTNASVETESNNVDEKDARTQNAEIANVKENVVLDAKIETQKTDSAPLIAPQEEVKSKGVAPHTSTENNATKEEEPKSQEVPRSSEQADGSVVEPIKESDTHTTETKGIGKTENSTSEAIAQVQIEEKSAPSTNEDDAKVPEKGVEIEENAQPPSVKEEDSGQTEEKQVQIALVKEEAPGEKTVDVEENKDGSDVDTKAGKVQEDVKEEVSAVALVEEDKNDSMPKQKDATPGDVKTLGGDQQEKPTEPEQKDVTPGDMKTLGGDQQDIPTAQPDQKDATPGDVKTLGGDHQETPAGSVIKSVETKEEPTEDNPIKTVETDSHEKQTDLNDDAKIKMVQSSQPESEDKEQIAQDSLLSVEQQDSSNNTDNSNGEISNPSDIKVDDEKIEEKNESSNDNTEITEKKGEEDNSKEVSHEETGEEKHELSDDNTEPKDKESENKETEEALQVKSEEKAEEIHEPSEEKAAESHEPSEENTEVKDKEGEGNDTEEVSQVKTDDETQAAAKEVESQLEALKRDTVFDTTHDQRQERDLSDDEYDIIQELADLPTKFQETAGKVADHLRPDLVRWTGTSKEYFNLANQQISESFSPLIGRQYAPFFASMISYGILLLPLLVVILLFEHIKALFSLQKVLLFINIYLAAYFATLWLASFIIGLEPMSFFYHNSLSSYLSLQLLQALGYVVYLILQTANMINSCSSETRVGKLTSGLQWVVAMGIGLHYYVTVFHPAVASKPPHTSWKFYAIYSAAFFILCLFARIRWVKKQYVSSGNDKTNKKS